MLIWLVGLLNLLSIIMEKLVSTKQEGMEWLCPQDKSTIIKKEIRKKKRKYWLETPKAVPKIRRAIQLTLPDKNLIISYKQLNNC